MVRISQACDPCSKLYLLPNVGKRKDIVKAMYSRRGWYASVEEEDEVVTGGSIIELT